MTGREMYNAQYEAARVFGYPAPAWHALSAEAQADWERRALEQTERDLEMESEGLAVLDNLEGR